MCLDCNVVRLLESFCYGTIANFREWGIQIRKVPPWGEERSPQLFRSRSGGTTPPTDETLWSVNRELSDETNIRFSRRPMGTREYERRPTLVHRTRRTQPVCTETVEINGKKRTSRRSDNRTKSIPTAVTSVRC